MSFYMFEYSSETLSTFTRAAPARQGNEADAFWLHPSAAAARTFNSVADKISAAGQAEEQRRRPAAPPPIGGRRIFY